MRQDNLSEDQNRRLGQNARRGAADAFAKPNLVEKEKIDRIVQSVGNHMTVEEIDTLYRHASPPLWSDVTHTLGCRYRYSLTENKKALTKFLFAVNWDEESEVCPCASLV